MKGEFILKEKTYSNQKQQLNKTANLLHGTDKKTYSNQKQQLNKTVVGWF